jgi:hypothetical protein
MVSSTASTPDEYIASLPTDRAAVISAVRDTLLTHLPPGYSESMAFGMIGYGIPLARYPKTYNKQPLSLVGLAAQKNYYALHLTTVYMDPATEEWFTGAWQQGGRKLDMGKGCVRFKSLNDVPLDVVGQVVARFNPDQYIALYEANRAAAKAK